MTCVTGSALAADEYCAAGLTCVAQDNIFGDDVARWLDQVTARRHLGSDAGTDGQ